MALRAASSLMSYTGPGGCNHSRPVSEDDDGTAVADEEWVLDCGGCEASLAGHELWGPADEPRPLTVDEIRRRDAQQADATRNVWAGLAAMPEQLTNLAMQNQATMAILAHAIQSGLIPGLPAMPVGELPVAPAAPKAAGRAPAKKAAAPKAQG